jgi:hypothetical protein
MPDIDKLDRKRPYGTVSGDPNIGFIQDGHSYRHDGSLFARSGSEPPVPPQGYGTIPPVDTVETATTPPASTDVIDGVEESLERQRNQQRSEAMKRIWAARKESK